MTEIEAKPAGMGAEQHFAIFAAAISGMLSKGGRIHADGNYAGGLVTNAQIIADKAAETYTPPYE